jgi:putative peptidoglycan lipid II flippase
VQLIRTIVTVGGYTFLYRISCVLRDTVQAAILGAGPIADAFVVAFKLANVLRKLFAEGSFNAAFLPRFSAILNKQGQRAAEQLASQVFSWLLIVLALLLVLCFFSFPAIIRGYAPGFLPGSDRFLCAVELGRLCFPYIATSFLVALFGSVLNTLNRFALPAASQLLLNIFLIVAMLLGACGFATTAHTMAIATFLAGLAQMFLLWGDLSYRAGFSVRGTTHLRSTEALQVFKKILPGAVGAGIWQLNLMIGVAVASSLRTGAVSCFYYADHVNQFPLGVLGIGLGTALLPPLSKAIQKGDWIRAQYQLNLGVLLAVIMTLPVAIFFLALPEDITSLFYEHGKFGHEQVCATAPALATFAVGLPAYMLAKVFSTALFAQSNTRHPCFAGLLSVATCIGTIPLFVPYFQQAGIALAISCAAWVNALALYAFLRYARVLPVFPQTWKACIILIFAGGAMWAVLDGGQWLFSSYFSCACHGFFCLCLLGGCGGLSFWLIGRWFGAFSSMHALMREAEKE